MHCIQILIPDVFLAVITSSTFLGNVRPGATIPENVSRVQEVQFFCINNPAFDDLSSVSDALVGPTSSYFNDSSNDSNPYASTSSNSTAPVPVFEHPCAPLTKILSTGTFYYSSKGQWDLSTRLSVRLDRKKAGGGEDPMVDFDERFVWNQYIAKPLLDFRERLDEQEIKEFDEGQFLVRPRFGYPRSLGIFYTELTARRASGSDILGPHHPRFCWSLRPTSPCTAILWLTYHRYSSRRIETWL